jgi:uncharacterized protein DUF4838/cellulose/xylan binding protein with CBM9 domain
MRILFLLFFAMSTTQIFADKCIIAENGRPAVSIVIPKDAGGPIKFAASELKQYLDKMTGANFKIVNAAKGKAIYLGKSKVINTAKIERDGYVIKVADGNLYIAGKDDKIPVNIPAKLKAVDKAGFNQKRKLMSSAEWQFHRGTLYGVYRLLEQLGVRWFVMGPQGERVPKEKNISFSGEIKEVPYFKTRVAGSWERTPYNYIPIKKRYPRRDFSELKTMGITPSASILWYMRMRGSSDTIALNHRPASLNWKGRFGKKHPEYFALLANGRRDLDVKKHSYRDHLCYTHPDVMKITLDEVDMFRSGVNGSKLGIPKRYTDRYAANNGWPTGVASGKYFSVLPHDSYRMCHCPNCKKFAIPGSPYSGQASKLIWSFIERCANQVKKGKYPDTKIVCLAYSSYSDPYPGMKKLPDNVVVGFCASDLKRPYFLHYKDNFEKFKKLAAQWDSKSKGPLAFWMHYLYRWAQPHHYAIPIHTPQMYEDILKVMSKHGRWAYIQLNGDSVMMELFNRYMLLKQLYNPNLRWKDLFNDYIDKFYGPEAGPIIKKVYGEIGAKSVEQLQKRSGRSDVWEKYYSPAFLKECRKQVTRAEKVTKGTEYEAAIKLFSKYYLGLMEDGQKVFDKNIRQVMKKGSAKTSFCRLRGPIKIDGVMDEKAWGKPIRRLPLYNNVNGKSTKWKTRVAVTRSNDTLYFGFICDDPKTLERSSKKGDHDAVEIFLDPNHDHNSYYQLFITMDGKVTDVFFEGNGEKGNHGWTSNAKVAVKRYKDKWTMEVAIPRKSFPENVTYPKYPWGANVCRTMSNPPRPEDRFSTWSKMIRGKFHQPDMFGHFFFTN